MMRGALHSTTIIVVKLSPRPNTAFHVSVGVTEADPVKSAKIPNAIIAIQTATLTRSARASMRQTP